MYRLWRRPIRGGIHICGCGHSGTSILTRLVGEHPLVYPVPGESGIAKKERFSIYREAVLRFWMQANQTNKLIWVEKTPKHIRHLNFILDAAPDSKIIVISRQPLDAIASMKRRYGSFRKALHRWRHDNKLLLKWKHSNQVYFLRYEDLVREPSNTLRQLMSYLGLEFNEAQLNYHQKAVAWYSEVINEQALSPEVDHKSLRNQQINQPLRSTPSNYLDILTPKEIKIVKKRCFSIACELGYKISPHD